MFQNKLVRQRVENLIAGQQSLIAQWKTQGHDVRAGYAARLRAVLKSALRLPHYARLIDHTSRADLQSWIAGDGADYLDALRMLPLLGKADAEAIGNDVLDGRRADILHYFETSGTTGRPTPAPKSLDETVVNTVNFGEGWAEFLTDRDRAVVLINTPQGPAAFQFEKALNYLGVLTFRTWVDTVRNDYGRVLESAQRYQPTVWAGPPSQLINLYEHASRANASRPRFEKVLLTGEPSGRALRHRLSRLTGGTVIDASFGSSETGTTAVACGHGLRLQTQSYLFELRTETGIAPVAPGMSATGELIATSLQNLNRPLIRYRTGDLVTITSRTDGAHILSPHGRIGNQVHLGDRQLTQYELEELIWPEDHTAGVFNYMIAQDGPRTDVFVTTDADHQDAVRSALAGLAQALPGAFIHVVDQLPVMSSLGSAMGWKAARVLDLRAAVPANLPTSVTDAIHAARQFVHQATGEQETRTGTGPR